MAIVYFFAVLIFLVLASAAFYYRAETINRQKNALHRQRMVSYNSSSKNDVEGEPIDQDAVEGYRY